MKYDYKVLEASGVINLEDQQYKYGAMGGRLFQLFGTMKTIFMLSLCLDRN